MTQSDQAPEMQLARAVQEALLTSDVPPCRCGQLVVKNRMFGPVGGDFYHFRNLGQDQVAFAVGDVMGHDLGAALLMTLMMGLLGADRDDHRRPSRVVRRINEVLLRLGESADTPILCSLLYGIVDLPTGIFLYVNAGHPHPIVCQRQQGTAHCLATTTMLLGVQDSVLPESCSQFGPDDRLVIFTDGITEAHNARGKAFGEENLLRIISQVSNESPEVLTKRIFEETDGFCGPTPPEDDQTLVVIDFEEVSTQFWPGE